MKAGRSGVISASTRKRKDMYRQPSDLENQDDNIKANLTSGTLSLYNTPVAVWAAGIFIILLGIYLLQYIIVGKGEGDWLKNLNRGYWWQYFIACIIIFVGFLFIFAFSMEKVDFNKQNDSIKYVTKNIICQHKVVTRKLTQLYNVSIVKRGQDTIQNKTLHYKLLLNFDDGTFQEMMETNSERKIRTKYIRLKIFLGQRSDLKQINIIDESTQPR